MKITTRKGWDPHNSDGLLDSLVGGIIQETLRYRSDMRPMAGVNTLTQALALSESDQTEMLFGFYRGNRHLTEEKGGTTITLSTAKNVTRMDRKVGDDHGSKER